MRSVLLVNPYRDYTRYLSPALARLACCTATLENLEEVWQPADMAYLYSVLKKSCAVRFLDAHLDRLPAEAIDFRGVDTVVASTAPYEKWRCTQIFHRHALDVLEKARSRGCRTVVYGPHPTVTPEEFAGVDAVIRGEPEAVIEEAVHSEKTGVFESGFIEDLDALPEPDYSIFDAKRYDARAVFEGAVRGPVAMLIGSRGCPYACAFCFQALVSRRVRYHTPEYLLSIVGKLRRDRGCRSFVFDDLTFTLRRDWAMALLDALEPAGVRFSVSTRVDCLDEALVRKLASSGCAKIELGVETASDDNLALMNKRITWDQVVEAVTMCRKHGIPVVSGFRMVFVPGETRESIEKMTRACRALGLDVFPNICTPYPQTPLWELGVKEGKIRGGKVHWEDAVLAAGTVGTGFSRQEVSAIAERLAWESHRPYLQSVSKYIRTYGCGKLFGKMFRTMGARLRGKGKLPTA
jgi:pyruvate-formate lyase-activating enzyme